MSEDDKLLISELITTLQTEQMKLEISKSGEVEWRELLNYGEKIKVGLPFNTFIISFKKKYIKGSCSFSFNRDGEGEMYIYSLSIFDKKMSNGVPVITNNESIGRVEYIDELETITLHPNYIQRVNDNQGILSAISIYESLVNKRDKEGSVSIPVTDFDISYVYSIDVKNIDSKNYDITKGKKERFVNQLDVNRLPSDSVGEKSYMQLKLIKPRRMPPALKKTLFIALKTNQLGYSTNGKATIDSDIVKLVDFNIKNLDKNKSILTLILDINDINDESFIHIFDRLSMIKSSTMLSVVKDIQANRINNNNLFQFLFNNDDYSAIGDLQDWEVNQELQSKYSENLNDNQKIAFSLATDTNPIAFIQGPPGTGKTHTITEICKYYDQLGKNVLVSSQTNVAVENILEKLTDDINFQNTCVKADFGKSKYSLEAIPNEIEKKLAKILGFDSVDLSFTSISEELVASRIIGSTTTSSSLKNRRWNGFDKNIDVLIVDEISKSSVPELIRFVVNSKKIVFVGDQKQLAPLEEFDDSDDIWNDFEDSDKIIIKKYISISIFDKLFETMRANNRAIMLTENHRSVKQITDVYSLFYDGKLISRRNEDDSNIKWNKKPFYPFTFLAMNGSKEFKESNGARYNLDEAAFVGTLLEELASKIDNANELTVAVIAMYGKQVQKITEQNEIKRFGKIFKNIKVNTVDAFQGDQADIVIISTVRADKTKSAGFISDYRRVNVALSRAKDLVVVLGNDSILKNIPMRYGEASRTFFNDIFELVNTEASDEFEKPISFRKVD